MGKSAFLSWFTDKLPQLAQRGEGAHPVPSRKIKRALSLCQTLLSERGEAAGAKLARDLHVVYQTLGNEETDRFFDHLATEFSPDPDAVMAAAEAYRADPSPANLQALQDAVEPPRQELCLRMNIIPGGTSGLVGMRKRVLRGLPTHPNWQPLESDLSHLLRSWFNRGFLDMRRIDWRTSALVLEKLIEYEAVHQIQGWRDLRRRLEADRRCYAYFHPALPDEPIIFIEVALAPELSSKVQPLLGLDSAVSDPNRADHAIFYSITNCQEGLRGISFGHFLIKQVAEDLGREFPRLRHFATLSPIPGFRSWLQSHAGMEENKGNEALQAVMRALARPDWFSQPEAEKLRTPLMQLCAHYLLHAKSRSAPTEPLDPVARFHLGNGAQLGQINWLSDTSPAGMQRSCGLMVNYIYKLADIERNHEAYTKEHRIIAASRIEDMAKDSLAGKGVTAGR
ncbi:MAG: malonyl-CoA decarboxylase [Candidatus Protistobacter heckmanni]|nr:malonyl-CoA decarboxylase [Candidatus Protistobacter heckmanni]